MDAFENVIASILQRRGYWTLTSVRVDLSKAQKRRIDRPSSPRWELDVVAYSGRRNELLVVECKSFLDSPGVKLAAFDKPSSRFARRYKLFAEPVLRRVVLLTLKRQLVKAGFCPPKPKIKLCLAAGKIQGDERPLRAIFKRQRWELIGPSEIRSELQQLKQAGYENSVAAIVAKLLLREPKSDKPQLEAES